MGSGAFIFQKISGGLRPPSPPPGALPLDPAGGCAPRPLPQLTRRRSAPPPSRNAQLARFARKFASNARCACQALFEKKLPVPGTLQLYPSLVVDGSPDLQAVCIIMHDILHNYE